MTSRALLLLATFAACGVSAERLGDFDGDGRADVLLRHADGTWRYDRSSQSGSPGEPVRMTRKPEWYWAGAGDFNGDGNDDVLMRRTDGAWVYYPLDASRVIVAERGWANLARNLDLRVAGVGDFNDDGRDDVLMRRTDGAWVYYPMNGRRVVGAERGWANLPRNADWRMAGTGDFDGDGRMDVLLRHVAGDWRYYAMDGRRVVADRPNGTRLTRDLLWQFAGTGDFDGDGRDEVLLRHADGRWQFGAIDDQSARVADLGHDWAWRLVGIGDSNGDGRDDILLRHDGGSWLWHLPGGDADQAQPGLSYDTAWAVPARAVYFPDFALRTAAEDALGKAGGEFIRPRELAALDTLVADFAGITDLRGIGAAVGLSWLNIEFNRIQSIVPLAGLVGLQSLYLRSNRVGDIAPLAHLPSLRVLDLGDNRIADISSLAALTALEVLDLNRNRIVDIAPLEHLTSLRELRLAFNRIADLRPLASNPGLGEGDLVDVRGNPLAGASFESVVSALLARGVRVETSARPRLADVHNDSVIVLHVGEDLATLNLFTGLPLDAYSSALYTHFEDAFDFVMFFSNLAVGEHEDPRYEGVYSAVRNDTAGIGLQMFYDNRFGSAERLKGVIHFPDNRALLDGPALHEMVHAWANYAIPTAVEGHWGFSSADGQLGGFDIADLVELGDGRYAAGQFGTFANGGNRPPYSPIEMYFAGYLPPEEVPDLWVAADGEWVFENGSPARTQDGQRVFSASDVRTYTVEDIVARNGARVPSMADAQWHFRVAAVLLTNDEHPASAAQLGLLSDHAALFSRRGSDGREAHNFFEATGGRGSVAMDGLAQFRKPAPAAVRDLPESYGVVPAPRASMVEGRSAPPVPSRRVE